MMEKRLKELGFKKVVSSDESTIWWELEIKNTTIFHKIEILYGEEDPAKVWVNIFPTSDDDEPLEDFYIIPQSIDGLEKFLRDSKIIR